MKIVYENYELIPEDGRFNLIKKYRGKSKKDNSEIDAEKNMGYSMTFERCLRVIADDIMESKETVFSISDYIQEFKKVVLILTNVLKQE